MKNVSRSAKFDLDNSVFIQSNQYGEIRHYEITGASVHEYFDGSQDRVDFYGYRLTKTGKRRKGDNYPSMMYVSKNDIIMLDDRWQIVDNALLRFTENTLRELGLGILYGNSF
jgi:hypothetical protein